MIYVVCSVRDSKAAAYGRPFFAPSVGVAIRSFTDEVNRDAEGNDMNRHFEDFTLFQLGQFDDGTGEFVTSAPHVLVSGDQVKEHAKVKSISRV